MSELREAVEEAIESAMIDGWHSMDPDTSLWKHNVQQQARAIVTAMREALLSDEAVEAVEAVAMERVTGGDIEQWREYRESYPIAAASSLFDAELALTAALAALGVETEEGQCDE